MFTFETLSTHCDKNPSHAESFRICNVLKNHLRSLLKMQIPRFTPNDGAPESVCLADIPGDFRASGRENTLDETILRF